MYLYLLNESGLCSVLLLHERGEVLDQCIEVIWLEKQRSENHSVPTRLVKEYAFQRNIEQSAYMMIIQSTTFAPLHTIAWILWGCDTWYRCMLTGMWYGYTCVYKLPIQTTRLACSCLPIICNTVNSLLAMRKINLVVIEVCSLIKKNECSKVQNTRCHVCANPRKPTHYWNVCNRKYTEDLCFS